MCRVRIVEIREVICIHPSAISQVGIMRKMWMCDSRLVIDRRRIIVRASQVRIVFGVSRCVALVWQSLIFAHLELSGGDGLHFLQLQRRFDKGCEEAGDEMPVYVAVECPDACRFSVSQGAQEQTRGRGYISGLFAI